MPAVPAPLSATHAEVVRATLPVVGAAIGDITPLFYRKMFAAHPDLQRDLFNRGNQAQGDQQRALAGAIAAYATMLVSDTGPSPGAVLERIANKHASLGITVEQYPIVHEHLFAAIVEVLGEAVTPEVAAAWDAVYWNMADALIALEKDLYAQAGVVPPDVWQRLVVTGRTHESPDTISFVLARPDGATLPPAHPGQYISVAVTLPDGARQIRQYSLTRAPEQTAWGISVKAVAADVDDDGTITPAGEVSHHLHHNVFEGDELDVSPAFGDLVLDDSTSPLLLISAGIGCTPIIGMLHYLTHTSSGRDVMVLHADRSPARHAHRQELKELVEQLPTATLHRWYEDLGVHSATDTLQSGRVDLSGIDIPAASEVYLCGPLPFMAGVRRALSERGIDDGRIHYEVFGPDVT